MDAQMVTSLYAYLHITQRMHTRWQKWLLTDLGHCVLQLKKQEQAELHTLREEWKQRLMVMETKFNCSVEQCQRLSQSLSNTTDELREKISKNADREQEVCRVKWMKIATAYLLTKPVSSSTVYLNFWQGLSIFITWICCNFCLKDSVRSLCGHSQFIHQV